MSRWSRSAPEILLALATLGAVALTLVLSAKASYFADTWDILINRREFGIDAMLDPHNEHLIALPVLFEQIFLRLFGMDTVVPEYLLLALLLAATAVLLYVYVKRRLGPWPALFAAVLVLFLGPAWEVLLWPFEITFAGPMLFGIATLLMLEREDRRGDLLACLFLVVALAFSSLGVPFVVAAFVAVLLGPRERIVRRAYVFAVPALLFFAWYAGWGHTAESHIGVRNVLGAPRAVADAVSSAVGSLLGLGTAPIGTAADAAWGKALAVALVVLLTIYLVRRRPPIPATLWPVAAAAMTSWGLTAFNLAPGRDPSASRYQYAGAIFVLLLLANLLSGLTWTRRALVATGAVTVLAVSVNLVVLDDGRDYIDNQAVLTRADTAAIEIARETIDPSFQLTPERAGTPSLVNVIAQPYLEAVDEFGSPAYSVEELASAPEPGPAQADRVLAEALPITAVSTAGGYRAAAGAGCTAVEDGAEVELGPGVTRIEIAPGPEAEVALRRFAQDQYPAVIGRTGGGAMVELTIPADRSTVPWQVQVDASQPARVCPA